VIDQSYLLGLFGLPTTGGLWSPPTGASSAGRKQPTAPWSAGVQAPAPSELVRAALGGRRILDEGAATVDLKGASPDYRKLFALYQAINTLSALADRAMQPRAPAAELALLEKRFASGLKEIADWLPNAAFEDLRIVPGVATSKSQSTAATPKGAPVYVTAPIHQGDLNAPVSAFAGDVRFSIRIGSTVGDQVVDIDLAGMGDEPRTLGAVLSYINGRLAGAGVQTRIGRTEVNTDPRTLTLGGKTVTLSSGPAQWALTVEGVSFETISFSAPQTSDAVFVVQAAGSAGAHEVLKFQSDGGTAPAVQSWPGETWGVEGRAGLTNLPPGVETVRASAAAPDGGLWLVADLKAGPDSQPIKGERDVALIKLDGAGQVVATRVLGAASTASGFALAVDGDGKVAVAGSVTGALDEGRAGADAAAADSFVTVFDAAGEELWTQRRGARAADEATAVVFGPDGVVHVAGRARSAMPGGVALGGWDGYLQSFRPSQAHPLADVTVAATAVSQFGTAGDDKVAAVAISADSLYSAGVESGRLVIRRFTLDEAGRPTLAAQRDLGAAGGEVTGLAVVDGQVIVSGVTTNPALALGTVTTEHSGGRDAFVAVMSADLSASAADRLTYVGGAADDGLADMKVLDGKVWITGVADRPAGAGPDDPSTGYLARLDPLTGAVEWRQEWRAADQKAVPLTLAVVAKGASILDRLGLPQGSLPQASSARLTANTAVRTGDRFYVSSATGGRPVAITIEDGETLESLARKIERASNRQLKVTLKTEQAKTSDGTGVHLDLQRLVIEPREGRAGAVLMSGEPGRDALAGLGLAPGLIGPNVAEDDSRAYGLNLPLSLSLKDPKAAQAKLDLALTALRSAYRSLAPSTPGSTAHGPAPAYLTAQIANYQAALARLVG